MYLRNSLMLSGLVALSAFAPGQTKPTTWATVPMVLPKAIQNALPTGPKAATDVLHISVSLPYRDPVAMQRFVDSVSDPKSPNYRRFLTPKQIGDSFGPSPATVKKITDYLTSCGMKVRLVSGSNLSVLADGTVAQAQTAFNTSIQEYMPLGSGLSLSGKRFAFTTEPSLPADFGSSVLYIGGLENFTQPKSRNALTPSQLRTLYSLAPTYGKNYQGQGRTVAISNFVGYLLSNVVQEYNQFNLPSPPGGVLSNIDVESIDGNNGSNVTENAEGDIDIQTVLAMAPLCNLIIYDDAGDSDLIGVLTQEATDDTADIISESYGWSSSDPSFFASAHNQHLAMSAAGITYLCASGDDGTQTFLGQNGSTYPDDDPEVLVVGGTTVTTDNAGNRQSEIGWTGSGGGWIVSTDAFNVTPAYQKGTGVLTGIPYRLVPDVALDADPNTGYNIYIGGQLEPVWGGTSCASPTFAGSLADCEQQIIAGGGLAKNADGKQRFGRIQDLLYSFNGDPTVFFDVTSGSNGTLPNGNASVAGPGWDTVTGWGTMIFSGFVTKVLGTFTPTAITVSPDELVGGNKATGTVTIGSSAPAGGVVVSLSSTNSSATVPTSVTVAAGSKTANFTVSTTPQSTTQTVTITGEANGSTVTTTFAVNPPALTQLQASPSSVVGGNVVVGTLSLSGVAPSGGISVALGSSSPNATVPASVNVPAGSSSATFSITTKAVTSAASATFSATQSGVSTSTSITIEPASLSSVSATPSSVQGGTSSSGVVSLNGAAPTGGLTIALKSSASAVVVPASVKVLAGAHSATFTITTKAVATNSAATITAKQGTNTSVSTLTVQPASLVGISVSVSPAIGGKTAITGTVTLNGTAPSSGMKVALTSSNVAALTLPASVTVSSGAKTAKFTITTKAVPSTTSVTITATLGSTSQTTTVTVLAPTLESVTVKPATIKGSSKSTVTGTVTIGSIAPTGGLVITLASSDKSAAGVAGTVTIAAGKTSATFTVTHSLVNVQVAVAISASVGGATKTANLTVTP